MPAEAPRLRRAKEQEKKALASFIKSLGLAEPPNMSLYVLEVPGASHNDLFDVPPGAERVLARLDSAYSAGYYVGSLAGARFIPGLPLAQRLSRLCGHLLDCVELDAWGSKVFLYGKEVKEDHIRRFAEGLRIVLDPLGETLGWGSGGYTTLKNKRVKIVSPVKDLGWYLRRGG